MVDWVLLVSEEPLEVVVASVVEDAAVAVESLDAEVVEGAAVEAAVAQVTADGTVTP